MSNRNGTYPTPPRGIPIVVEDEVTNAIAWNDRVTELERSLRLIKWVCALVASLALGGWLNALRISYARGEQDGETEMRINAIEHGRADLDHRIERLEQVYFPSAGARDK